MRGYRPLPLAEADSVPVADTGAVLTVYRSPVIALLPQVAAEGPQTDRMGDIDQDQH